MDDQLILKNRLKIARAEKNLSQGELAKLVGVSRQTISSIETGQFNPTAKLALVLCIALDKKFEDPVSYTHLDVYKRQLVFRSSGCIFNPSVRLPLTAKHKRCFWQSSVTRPVSQPIGSSSNR